MTCFFVIGPENSGAKMLMSAFLAAGCHGDATDEQRLDTLAFAGEPPLLAFRRSVPHGWTAEPELRAIADRITAAGYQVRPVAVYRNTTYLTAGQLRRGYAQTPEQVRERVGVALRLFLALCAHVGEPPLLVPYEAFVTRPEFREAFFAQLGLPAPAGEFWNANEGYSSPALVPW